MEVTYKKHINIDKKNRTEFLFVNWDYENGNDCIAKIFCKEFGMSAEEKRDYIYFSVIKLHLDNLVYELLWHEDFGNMIYAIEPNGDIVDTLEQRLKVVLKILNKELKRI